MGFDKYVPWIVFGVVAYFIVTKTTILQNFASGLKNLGSGGGSTSGDSGGGGQTAQAQPQSAPAASTPSSTTSAPAPATTTVQAPKAIPTVTAIGKQAGAVAHQVGPAASNVRSTNKAKVPKSGAPPPKAKVIAPANTGGCRAQVSGTSGPESGPGCGGCGNGCKGTRHWYTPGTNAQHARHHCYQGCSCCYLNGVEPRGS